MAHRQRKPSYPLPALTKTGSPEVVYKVALTCAAATLREATATLSPHYRHQGVHLAELMEAMAGEEHA